MSMGFETLRLWLIFFFFLIEDSLPTRTAGSWAPRVEEKTDKGKPRSNRV